MLRGNCHITDFCLKSGDIEGNCDGAAPNFTFYEGLKAYSCQLYFAGYDELSAAMEKKQK